MGASEKLDWGWRGGGSLQFFARPHYLRTWNRLGKPSKDFYEEFKMKKFLKAIKNQLLKIPHS